MRAPDHAAPLPSRMDGPRGPIHVLEYRYLSLVAAVGWGLNVVVSLALAQWSLALVKASWLALYLLVRALTLRAATPRGRFLGIHLTLAQVMVSTVVVSLAAGPGGAIYHWYLVLMPMVVAYLLDRRSTIAWTALVCAGFLFLPPAGGSVPVLPPLDPEAMQRALVQVIVTLSCLGFGLAARHGSDEHLRVVEAARADAERARHAAEAASRAKSDFLATMSHEIRTPLNGVIGLNGLLRDSELGAEQRRYVELARLSGETLLSLINDILDLSKIEAGRLELEPLPFCPAALLRELADLQREPAAEKGLALQAEPAADLPAGVRGDPARLRQILTNLLGNAVKFTERGEVRLRGRVIRADAARVVLRFEVSDTGPGMDAATRDRLFQPFTQGDVSTTRRFGGTGLGLSISRRLAELMGGQVGVETAPGQGSRFWVEVPFERLDAAALAEQARAEAEPSLAAAPLRGRVLVAEDNPVNQVVAAAILQRLGCRVDVVGNGLEAVEAVKRLPYDLVILDCHMPEMDGFEACGRIRALQAGQRPGGKPHLPIVAMTASALKGDREKCLAAGMDDYLPKPVRVNDLRATVQRWIGG